jgi:hypothetical protein
MKLVHAAVIVASALAMLSLAPLQAGAKAHASHGFHFSNRLHAAHHNGAYGAYGAWPFYGGGIVAVPPYAPENAVSYAPATVVYVPLPPQALTCHRSRQTVTVPAEAGGTRQITVTRC